MTRTRERRASVPSSRVPMRKSCRSRGQISDQRGTESPRQSAKTSPVRAATRAFVDVPKIQAAKEIVPYSHYNRHDRANQGDYYSVTHLFFGFF